MRFAFCVRTSLLTLSFVAGVFFNESAVANSSNQSEDLNAKDGWHLYHNGADDLFVKSADGSFNVKVATATSKDKEPGISHALDFLAKSGAAHAPEGLPLHVRFWARCAASSTQPARLAVAIMESKAPYAPTMSEKLQLNSQWKEFEFDAVAPPGGEGSSMHFKPRGSVDIRNISVEPEALEKLGINRKDITPQGVDENIDRYRKTEVTVLVLDADGKPVPKAEVHIKQTKQEFLFGTEVQGLNPDDKSAAQSKYTDALTNTFNFATVTPYWPQVEKQEGKVDYGKFDQQVSWLSDHKFTVKMHPAFWPHFTPKFVPLDPSRAQTLADRHTHQFVEHFSRDRNVRFFENNEVAAALSDSTDNGVVNWVKLAGAPAVLEHETEIERHALGLLSGAVASSKKQEHPSQNPIQIIYNDYLNNQQETQLLNTLKKNGKLPDAIGIQMHMTQGDWPIARVQKIVQDLATYGKPIYITEISVLSGDHRLGSDKVMSDRRSWPSTSEGEAHQADYVEKLYKQLFSNPSVKGITWWDLTDLNSWQGAPRGLLRDDMSRKPAFDRLHELIQTRWRTDLICRAATDGTSKQRVFTGDYEISASDDHGHSTSQRALIKNGYPTTVTIQLDQIGSGTHAVH